MKLMHRFRGRPTYVLVNPFNPEYTNGVVSYFKSAESILAREMDIRVVHNTQSLGLSEFRLFLREHLEANYEPDRILIEAPETRAATLLLDRSWRVHVRLHSPLAIVQKHAGLAVDQSRFSDEIRVIAQADIVSSPSYGLVTEMQKYVKLSEYVVCKNPIDIRPRNVPWRDRDIDVISMSPVNKPKGGDSLPALVELLPSRLRIAVVGTGASLLDQQTSSRLTLQLEHINDGGRFDYLARAKVAVFLSRFENCSMFILECIAHGVPVVAWGVGGNSEFPPNLVKTVRLDDVEAMAKAIACAVDTEVAESEFERAVTDLNNDYVQGIRCIAAGRYRYPFLRHKSKFRPRRL